MNIYVLRILVIEEDNKISLAIDSIFNSIEKAYNFLKSDLFENLKQINSNKFKQFLNTWKIDILDCGEVFLFERFNKKYYYMLTENKLK
ncbi:hypothetical protein SGLAD_v1c06310 [Spiroplasma gladiatoris]|uniref:Uncharacterized protein n=1 Tax=Spiroplasma gladiatoris TaxID=2143 RepID=A0A4P7AJV0_9MOLU|nr:hypothetical protein [Spiroplasma gladiatoris]QBQ07830.1 hypothetical protein SGLAD_v1c06310 [Spiroplasma gladiatoris]